MCDTNSHSCSQDSVYWGEDKKIFEDIEVELKSTENSPSFTLRNMSIHDMKVTHVMRKKDTHLL